MVFVASIKNLKNLKFNIIFFYYLPTCKNEDEKIFKEKESIEILNNIKYSRFH